MWLIAMFDLPVKTKQERREYANFVKFLKRDGFTRVQFSVYGRHTPSEENAAVHEARIQANLPPEGEVRLLKITDKQFERMKVFWGKKRRQPEEPPPQLQLF